MDVALCPPVGSARVAAAQLKEIGGGGRALELLGSKSLVVFSECFSENAGPCREVKMIFSNLGVPQDSMVVYELDSMIDGWTIGSEVSNLSGIRPPPIIFLNGKSMGSRDEVVSLLQTGRLQELLAEAGVKTVGRIPEATLADNIFAYPKALVHGGSGIRHGGRMNVLIGSCGSSASDKIPELVERCTAQGWNVKLVTTRSGEHFFKAFGMQRIMQSIGPENMYRDDDEWNFEYQRFGMPVRACHLALRQWADVMVVAPVTCNSIAKAAAGIGDTLVTSVFIAWQYHRKSMIFCPACNTDMWKNAPTQRNVAFLKTMGIEFMGPRQARLSNGQMGIGAMETVDAILQRLSDEESTLCSGPEWFLRMARRAAAENSLDLWELVIRAVEEKQCDVNITEEDGDGLLHFAVGGEGDLDDEGNVVLGTPDVEAVRRLINCKADVNTENGAGVTPLEMAATAGSAESCELLVKAGARVAAGAEWVRSSRLDAKIAAVLKDATPGGEILLKASEELSSEEAVGVAKADKVYSGDEAFPFYFFIYGTYKRGFPNHTGSIADGMKFVAEASTAKPLMVTIQKEPSCNNPGCNLLHRRVTTYLNDPELNPSCPAEAIGQGKGPVRGELFKVSAKQLSAMDSLENYNPKDTSKSSYLRVCLSLTVPEVGMVKAYAYGSIRVDEGMAQLEAGTHDMIDFYPLELAGDATLLKRCCRENPGHPGDHFN
eukprot:TRINITY_DN107776_c0_g1_i1.p1 TRINITY_DN107776_c0_g1~~TRINITY_DN107776_c0_g1_i1.p1  ORF type:complete len:716 (-),score=109.81 TRINITY_DN107776_c0_g1_i1:93-2240(-)